MYAINFIKIAEKLDVSFNECMMVGDWPERDVVGANNLGIRTIFARYGDSFGTINSGADWDINDVYEIVGIVNELNSA